MIDEGRIKESDANWSYGMKIDDDSSVVEVENDRTSAGLERAQTIMIEGTITWEDVNGNTHPCKGIEVKIFDTDMEYPSTLLRTTYTDSSGYYMATILNDTSAPENGYDIQVMAYAKSQYINICNSTDNTYYVYTATSYNVGSINPLVKNISISKNTSAEKTFQVHQAALMANNYINSLNSTVISTINIEFPVSTFVGTHYSLSYSRIYIIDADYCDWDVIQHEYGHYVEDFYNFYNSPGGSHSSKYNMIDEFYSPSSTDYKEKGIKLAWAEGWATYFAISLQLDINASSLNIPNVGDTHYQDTIDSTINNDLEIGNESPVNYSRKLGEGNELMVSAILLDLADGYNETYDQSYFGYATAWNIIAGSPSNTIYSLWDYMNAFYSCTSTSQHLNAGKILNEHGVASTLSLPSSYSTLSSTNKTFSWVANGGSVHCPNDSFKIRFYNTSYSLIYETSVITSTSYTLTSNELSTILGAAGSTIYWTVIAYQTTSPQTGGYYSYYNVLYK